MKKIIITCIFTTAITLTAVSQKNGTSSSYSDDKNGNTQSIVINDDNGKLEIKFTGDIGFNEAGNAVETIAAGSYVKYKKNGKSISVFRGENGKPVYEINGSNKKTDLNTDESAFVATAIKDMLEHGIGGKARVEQIYKKGGASAVLKEVEVMKGDYVKAIYLNYLLETSSLTNTEVIDILHKTDNLVSSDFEKGNILKNSAHKYISNEATMQAYLDAIKNIGSDFEKANAIKSILKDPLNDPQFPKVLLLTNDIGSDFEKANVLKEVLENNKISANRFSEVLKTTANIGSDFEKANVLKNILKNNKLPESQFNETLAVINDIGSDFEKANILKEVAGQKISNELQWISLINATEKIGSDFEKSNVLVSIAAEMPQSPNVRTAYKKAAKTISSDGEYGKVIRATDKQQ